MSKISEIDLEGFLIESNQIEGIARFITDEEMETAGRFLALETIRAEDVENLVNVFQPGAKLRDQEGMDVRVGSHVAPRGGPEIRETLYNLLGFMCEEGTAWTPYTFHAAYEALHPFQDGNGRSGRMIWLWQMQRLGLDTSLGFLHLFYYQALEAGR